MARIGALEIIRAQRRTPAPVVKRDLSSKTVIITGANGGLGLEAAKHFASMNAARLILACRNKEKGEEALKRSCWSLFPKTQVLLLHYITDIQEETGYTKAELWLLDLSRFASVVEFAEKFEQDGGKIDILVANAAISTSDYNQTSDGWDESSVFSK